MLKVIKEHCADTYRRGRWVKRFIEITMLGKLTHEDYKIFVPMVDKALKKAKGIEADLLIDMRGFKGWEFMAAWDDFKFGVKHRNAFKKMAIVGDKNWEDASTAMMSHLMSGKPKFFKKREKALSWLLKN